MSLLGLDSDHRVFSSFRESFLELTETDVKEMVKPIGIVKKVVKLQREV